MKIAGRIAAAAGVASIAVMPLVAQQPATGRPTPPTTTPMPAGQDATHKAASHAMGGLSTADTTFMKQTAIGGMAEVELGKLASEQASSPEVKQFGAQMVTDHTKANDELKALATQKQVTLPTALDAKHMATRDKLAKLSGAAFDRAYVREMVVDHDKDVAAFKRESTAGSDADLKGWAAQTLPTLQSHQKMIKAMSGKMSTGNGPSK